MLAIPFGRKANGLVRELTRLSDTNATWALRAALPDARMYIVNDTTVYYKSNIMISKIMFIIMLFLIILSIMRNCLVIVIGLLCFVLSYLLCVCMCVCVYVCVCVCVCVCVYFYYQKVTFYSENPEMSNIDYCGVLVLTRTGAHVKLTEVPVK